MVPINSNDVFAIALLTEPDANSGTGLRRRRLLQELRVLRGQIGRVQRVVLRLTRFRPAVGEICAACQTGIERRQSKILGQVLHPNRAIAEAPVSVRCGRHHT